MARALFFTVELIDARYVQFPHALQANLEQDKAVKVACIRQHAPHRIAPFLQVAQFFASHGVSLWIVVRHAQTQFDGASSLDLSMNVAGILS